MTRTTVASPAASFDAPAAPGAARRPLRRDGTWSVPATGTPPVQRTPIDPTGKPLTTGLPYPLTEKQSRRLAKIEAATDKSHLFRDAAALDDYLSEGSKEGMKVLDLDPVAYTAGLPKATLSGRKRKSLAPLKARTTAKKRMVEDVPEFDALPAEQLPPLPEGNFIYRSEKRKSWKRRATSTADDDWKMALYQSKPGGPVAYNMSHGGDLQASLFQYSQGSKPKKGRQMAGMEGQGKTPKWTDPSIGTTGKKRKLNKFPHTAVVQGHGQDFESTMPWLGDYDASHSKADKTLTTGALPIIDSDTHPMNFSGEHPIYGQNFRNFILGQAQKAHPQGAILEHTTYHNATIPVTVPKGVAPVRLPQSKSLATFDASGTPQQRYQVPQMQPDGSGGHDFVDLAAIAETHSNKKAGDAAMQDLADATSQTQKTPSNPSYVPTGNATTGINAWTPMVTDTPAIQTQLKRADTFFHFKEKDFI